jgi:DNA polymerase III subunit delta
VSSTTSLTPVVLVTGDDEVMVAAQLRLVLEGLLGGRDPSLALEEFAASGSDGLDVGAVIDAYTTPPFLVDRRVVVVRDAGAFDKEAAARLLEVLDPPAPGAALVLVGGGGRLVPALAKKAQQIGEVHDVGARKAAQKRQFVAEHLRHGSVRLSAGAQKMLEAHLGEELGRLDSTLETLGAAYGDGVTVDEAMLEPFLGSRGSVPIWDLTDALEAGSIAGALAVLDRMMGPGGASAHEILASIDSHVSRAARLQGAPVTSGEDAAALLGVHAFPAKKSLDLSRRLDVEALADCLGFLAQADLDVKGLSGLDPRVVMEVLVARLTQRLSARR